MILLKFILWPEFICLNRLILILNLKYFNLFKATNKGGAVEQQHSAGDAEACSDSSNKDLHSASGCKRMAFPDLSLTMFTLEAEVPVNSLTLLYRPTATLPFALELFSMFVQISFMAFSLSFIALRLTHLPT